MAMGKKHEAEKLAARVAAEDELPAQTTSAAHGLADGWLSAREHAALGKAARKATPLSTHAAWKPAPDRPDPIALLRGQDAVRVPELVPIRWGRMSVSPFTFFRGAALTMAADLATTPTSGLRVQLCGDAHLMNFGVFGPPTAAWSST
jgi:Uncharacterized protein conserved in bacteria (DUF2252)